MSVAKICRDLKPTNDGHALKEQTLGRFMRGEPVEQWAILLAFAALKLEAVVGEDFERADPLPVPEAPAKQVGAYVHRKELEEAVLDRIEFHLAQGPNRDDTGLLVALEGEGGVGKTRLAIEIARRSAEWSLPARFVSLAHLAVSESPEPAERRPELMLQAIASSCTFGMAARMEVTVIELLRSSPLLLILDNLESVLCEEVAACLLRVVAACPSLVVVVTSRRSLGVETSLTLDLERGMTEEEALQLLQLRISEFLPSDAPARKLNQAELRDVVKQCFFVPLAIENVAAMARTALQPSRVAHELKQIAKGMPDPLDITNHFKDPHAADRNRSMASSLLWGYRQIRQWGGEDAERIQRAYRISGIFAGPFTSDDFDAIAGRGESRWLTELQTAYVIEANPSDGAWTQNIFRRAFACRLLQASDEYETVRSQFIHHFFGRLEREGRRLGEPDANWELLRSSQPNWIRAAYLVARRIDEGDCAAIAMFHGARFSIQNSAWYLGWDIEPLLIAVEAAAAKREEAALWADCARGLGTVHLCLKADPNAAYRWFSKALDLYRMVRDREGEADCLRCLADCETSSDASLNLLRLAAAAVPNTETFTVALIRRSIAFYLLRSNGGSSSEEGHTKLLDARSLLFKLGRYADVASCDLALGEFAVTQGNFEEGQRIRKCALQLARASRDLREQIFLLMQGLEWRRRGGESALEMDWTTAWSDLVEATDLNRRYGESRVAAQLLRIKADLLIDVSSYTAATHALQQAIHLFECLYDADASVHCRQLLDAITEFGGTTSAAKKWSRQA